MDPSGHPGPTLERFAIALALPIAVGVAIALWLSQPHVICGLKGDRVASRITRHQLGILEHALHEHVAETGEAPTTLKALVGRGAAASPLRDAWGTPFIYSHRALPHEEAFTLASAGPDRTAGTEDDLHPDLHLEIPRAARPQTQTDGPVTGSRAGPAPTPGPRTGP